MLLLAKVDLILDQNRYKKDTLVAYSFGRSVIVFYTSNKTSNTLYANCYNTI